jgi:hypothetical protein
VGCPAGAPHKRAESPHLAYSSLCASSRPLTIYLIRPSPTHPPTHPSIPLVCLQAPPDPSPLGPAVMAQLLAANSVGDGTTGAPAAAAPAASVPLPVGGLPLPGAGFPGAAGM